MSTIQQQLQMYNALETVLRQAAEAQQPMALADIWEVSSIREAAPKMTHVRDKLKVLQHHNLVTRVGVAASQSGNKMARVGYMWANADKTVEQEIKFRASTTREGHGCPPRPQRMQAVAAPVPDTSGLDIYFEGCVIHGGRNVELSVSDVKMIVSKNAEGKLIIKIE
jgi:hypothetical protein